jgi:hypothetical protein
VIGSNPPFGKRGDVCLLFELGRLYSFGARGVASELQQKTRRGFPGRAVEGPHRLGVPGYLIFASLYITCFRALGSNFLISIFSGMVFLFFVVV